jgi:hypothetical protein
MWAVVGLVGGLLMSTLDAGEQETVAVGVYRPIPGTSAVSAAEVTTELLRAVQDVLPAHVLELDRPTIDECRGGLGCMLGAALSLQPATRAVVLATVLTSTAGTFILVTAETREVGDGAGAPKAARERRPPLLVAPLRATPTVRHLREFFWGEVKAGLLMQLHPLLTRSGSVKVLSTRPGAALSLDGVALSAVPSGASEVTIVGVRPGQRRLSATYPAGEHWSVVVHVVSGEATLAEVDVAPQRSTAGTLRLVLGSAAVLAGASMLIVDSIQEPSAPTTLCLGSARACGGGGPPPPRYDLPVTIAGGLLATGGSWSSWWLLDRDEKLPPPLGWLIGTLVGVAMGTTVMMATARE